MEGPGAGAGARAQRLLGALLSPLRILRPIAVPVFHDPAYRVPIPSMEGRTGADPRRADLALGYLLDRKLLRKGELRLPRRASYEELARVHSARLLESLLDPSVLARIFGTDAGEVPVDELMNSVRLGCGGTVEAAREALRSGGPTMNLFGGFHHAGPDSAGGMCPVNDLAVAVAAVRAGGFDGEVAILDLDAHPPDGTAACFAGDPRVFLGSLSGSDWGTVAGADETLLPRGTTDEPYLAALAGLLSRMPQPDLCFVLAGGDVLAGDRLGLLGLTLAGVRRRDLLVARALAGTASVWLPGGGYTPDAWRALAGTYLAVSRGSARPISRRHDPLKAQFGKVYATLRPRDLVGELELTDADIGAAFGYHGGPQRLLGYYTAEGIEYAYYRYGILAALRRLGYDRFRVALDRGDTGERSRLFGTAQGTEHLLAESVLGRAVVAGKPVLFVNWMTLRHPLARFDREDGKGRPQLPGQEVPGLGLAREATELLLRMAQRLGLEGLAVRPAWYHVAYAGRAAFRFVDPARQGRFEALCRDLAGVPLLTATHALADGRVLLDGEPYRWEADDMVLWLSGPPPEEPATVAAREGSHFTIRPAA